MVEKKISTHRAYASKREGHIFRWVEIGVASVHSDGKGFEVYLDRLPVGGFDGHVLVRANDARPEDMESPSMPSSEGAPVRGS
jgi:hypothetical protein